MSCTGVLLKFHPYEKCVLSLISKEEIQNAYITHSKCLKDNILYDIITISFYYKENLAIGCGWCLFPKSAKLGYHQNDIEYITLYMLENEVIFVYFSAHSSKQGIYVSWKDCEKTNNNELIVYVALNSHANYPKAKTYLRIFGFANDYCSKYGKSKLLPFDKMLLSYNYSSYNGITLYKGSRPTPSNKSITSWERFFLPFYI